MKDYENKEKMKDIRLIFNTMVNPMRIKIIRYLIEKKGSIFVDIQKNFNLEYGIARFHLKKLLIAGIITRNSKFYVTDLGRKLIKIFEDFDRVMSELK